MSFTLNRDGNNKAIKKNVTITNTINPLSLKASIGSTGDTNFVVLDTLSINNTQITATSDQLNVLNLLTAGVAEANKAFILNSSRNFTGLNRLTLNVKLIANGQEIMSNADLSAGSSDDLNNVLLTNITAGIGQSSKALICDNSRNLQNINRLSLASLKLQNNNVNILSNDIGYNLENINKYSYINKSIITDLFSTCEAVGLVTSDFNVYNGRWKDVCWSPDLEILVAISSGNDQTANANRVALSYNGIAWWLYPATNNTISWNSICWSPELSIFIAVGATGNIMSSPDGMAWTSQTSPASIDLLAVTWSSKLNLFVAVTNSNRFIYSSNGTTWVETNAIPSGMTWQSICWANNLNLFVAMASSSSPTFERCIISNDGINWQLISSPILNNTSFNSVCYSDELNLFVAVGNSIPNRIVYSSDAINWKTSYASETGTPNFNFAGLSKCIWVSELMTFFVFSYNSSYSGVYYSYDGIRWKYTTYTLSGTSISSACWVGKFGCLIGVSEQNTNRLLRFKSIKGVNSSLKSNNVLYFDKENNRLGINTMSPSRPLEINHSTGQCLKFNRVTPSVNSYANFNLASNGQLNLDVSSTNNAVSSVNILTDFSTYGLKLNNILLTAQITDYSKIIGVTNGTASANKIAIVDNNRNITNINQLSCTSMLVNGEALTDSNNNSYLQNVASGVGTASKGLILDGNKNIININNISTNKLNLNFNKINGSDVTNTVNVNYLKNKYQNPCLNYFLNKMQTSNWIQNNRSSDIFIRDMCWSPELNLYVIVGDSSFIQISNDGITWTTVFNTTINNGSTFNFSSVCWSPELNMFIAVYNGGMLTSSNGINWGDSRLTLSSAYTVSNLRKIIWVSDLQLFIAVGDNFSNDTPIMISSNGVAWNDVMVTPTNVSYSIRWCNTWGLLVMISQTGIVYTSNNAINWTTITVPNIPTFTSSEFTVAWSEELNICIAGTGAHLYYSYDGTNWFYTSTSGVASFYNIIWIPELNIFYNTGGHNQAMSYSIDGLNWTSITQPPVPSETSRWEIVFWNSETSMLFAYGNGTTKKNAYNIIGLPNSNSYLYGFKNQIYFDKINSRLGLGTTNPSYQLHLTTDEAAKPSSSSWTIVSDSRLKENIELCNLNICYDTIKNLDLKRYTWKDEIFNEKNNLMIYDRTKLGWIADDVEQIFPKAVNYTNLYNIENCKTLNIDQIIASMYGCTQKLIDLIENFDSDYNDLNNDLNNVETFLNSI